jgi:hypothetical protein
MQITVPVEDITEVFTLRNHVGEGSFGDTPVKLASSIPSASPIIEVDGKLYLVSIHDIAKAVLKQVVGE